jgi:hypothetical protein
MKYRILIYGVFAVLEAFVAATVYIAMHASMSGFDLVRTRMESFHDLVIWLFPFSLFLPLMKLGFGAALSVTTFLTMITAHFLATPNRTRRDLPIRLTIYFVLSLGACLGSFAFLLR